jgi:hypothetical protein
VVELVGHAFLLCRICLDVDNISDSVRNQKCGKFYGAMFYPGESSSRTCCTRNAPESTKTICTFEAPLEHMARTRSVTERVRHFRNSASSKISDKQMGQ